MSKKMFSANDILKLYLQHILFEYHGEIVMFIESSVDEFVFCGDFVEYKGLKFDIEKRRVKKSCYWHEVVDFQKLLKEFVENINCEYLRELKHLSAMLSSITIYSRALRNKFVDPMIFDAIKLKFENIVEKQKEEEIKDKWL